jgi:enoyl-CoA hydratase/carnithine racemase
VTLKLSIADGVAHLSIDRAEKRNAMTQAMWEQVPALLAYIEADQSVRVVVLASAAAGIFCAGADIGELLANKDDADWRARNQTAINRAQHDLARLPIPTVAFVDGDCVGGGTGLAMACDIRVATARARFGITPAKLGLVYPLHDTKLLVDLVGPGQAKRLLFTGELIDAAEAQRIGLVEILAEEPYRLAAQIAAASPSSCSDMKAFVRRILDGQADDDAETLAIFAGAFTGVDFLEGTTAFIEKRKPEFGA